MLQTRQGCIVYLNFPSTPDAFAKHIVWFVTTKVDDTKPTTDRVIAHADQCQACRRDIGQPRNHTDTQTRLPPTITHSHKGKSDERT